MEFLKKHYEKLILAVLLLLFILSMLYLLLIIRNTSGITAKDLDIPTRAADFKPISVDDVSFDAKGLMAIGREWHSKMPRDPKYQDFSSNLIITFRIARCAHCNRLIPFYFFSDNPCPLCGEELRTPNIIDNPEADEKIPQAVKDALGQPNLPELGDLDGDGFSNLYEYKQKTALNNPADHPPLWHRLVLVKIEKVKLPYKLMKVNTAGSEDKAKWDLQVNRTDTGKTEFSMLNDILKIDGVDYRINDVKLDQRERKVGNDTITEDRSIIYLEMLGGDRKLEMQVGSDVYSTEPKAFLLDSGDNNRILTLDVGAEFRVGNRLTGVERYRIKSIDQTENKVYLVYRTRGANYNKDVPDPITKEGKIPVNQRINLMQQLDMMGPMM